jgi:PHP family Zn ribbon phosphoesterase
MDVFRADLHIHTVLSPCGSLEMSPVRIVETALNKKLAMIGITDHNSSRQCKVVAELGLKRGLMVLCGAEVSSKEEVHCITFFETFEKLEAFQAFLDAHLPVIKNDPEKFGDQVWVDEQERILGEEPRLLIAALDKSLEEIERMVHQLDGIIIAAHIDRPKFSLMSQLGFYPPDLRMDAVEVTVAGSGDQIRQQFALPADMPVLRNSDAHMPEQIGQGVTYIRMKEPAFRELKMALKGQAGRGIMDQDRITT